jgi:hypothetical protein
MPEITPRHKVTTPSQFEEPYFESAQAESLGWDAATYANAENSQLQFLGGGLIGWDKDNGGSPNNGVLFWTENIQVSAFTDPYEAVISGPASIELQETEVLFFVMPRLMKVDTPVQLYRSNRIFLEGTRLHDLRLFAARLNDVVYFYNGKSLTDGDQGLLFSGGLLNLSTSPLHTHHAALVVEPGAIGVTAIDMQLTSPDLTRVELYRNGQLLNEPDDYTMNFATGIATLVAATANTQERFVGLRYCVDLVSSTTDHEHLAPLIIEPLPAISMLDMLVSDPVVQAVDLHRNGMLLAEPGDYSLNTGTGFVTLVDPTIAGERFVALRRINA